MTGTNTLTHLNTRGEASMVDVSEKPDTARTACAEGFVHMAPETVELIRQGGHSKGDVLATARIAGIQAAKKTADLIPLCHPLPLTRVRVEFTLSDQPSGVRIAADCRTTGKTGVEMEALTAVSVAGLTLFDMCKAVDRTMRIDNVAVVSKTGGLSGDWQRPSAGGTDDP